MAYPRSKSGSSGGSLLWPAILIVLACASVAWLVWSQKGGGGAIKTSHKDSHLYAILDSEVEDCSAYQGMDRDPIATLLGRDETSSCVAVQEGLLFHAESTKAQVRHFGCPCGPHARMAAAGTTLLMGLIAAAAMSALG